MASLDELEGKVFEEKRNQVSSIPQSLSSRRQSSTANLLSNKSSSVDGHANTRSSNRSKSSNKDKKKHVGATQNDIAEHRNNPHPAPPSFVANSSNSRPRSSHRGSRPLSSSSSQDYLILNDQDINQSRYSIRNAIENSKVKPAVLWAYFRLNPRDVNWKRFFICMYYVLLTRHAHW